MKRISLATLKIGDKDFIVVAAVSQFRITDPRSMMMAYSD